MASVDWMKCTTAMAGRLKMHMDNKERVTYEHDNPHINTDKTYLNYYIGAKDFDSGIKQLKERIDEVDKQIPPERFRDDRKTCVMLEVPCPEEISKRGESDAFFEEMHKLYISMFGKENVIYTAVHKDEVHEYKDARTGKTRMSLEHAHTLVVAYTPEKGVNGKAFFVRERYKDLNDAADRMCFDRFGIHLNVGTVPGKEKVEQLKKESAVKEMEHKTQAQIQEYERQIEYKKSELKAVEAQYDKAVSDVKEVIQIKTEIAATKRSGRTIVDEKMASELLQLGDKIQQRLKETRELSAASVADKYEIDLEKRKISETKSYIVDQKKSIDEDRIALDSLIKKEAMRLVSESFRGSKTSREERLERFCSNLRMGDGRTALERFNDDEKLREEEIKENISGARDEERPE